MTREVGIVFQEVTASTFFEINQGKTGAHHFVRNQGEISHRSCNAKIGFVIKLIELWWREFSEILTINKAFATASSEIIDFEVNTLSSQKVAAIFEDNLNCDRCSTWTAPFGVNSQLNLLFFWIWSGVAFFKWVSSNIDWEIDDVNWTVDLAMRCDHMGAPRPKRHHVQAKTVSTSGHLVAVAVRVKIRFVVLDKVHLVAGFVFNDVNRFP
ncbi:hypothetical protein LBCZ_0990 [Lacticaseibacillus casei DSM 20011 = JCM 1134 = ATCC 393]|uniref:Uncharacterized protein n=1 Tax=Lacticaseibacillus casei DSM 20011 = JCM 1134 = ATCC 393 TaxID=1423732 RepID=A0AAD1AP53_LACCA|nr:hypothetical protein LBCZ_0990 [Lacticaseibacillus casei DSM 20011 = JCM 1134 = ATCC 393]